MKTIKLRAVTAGIIALSSSYAMHATAAPIFSFTEYAGFEGGMVSVANYSNPVVGDALVVPAVTPLYSTMSWNSISAPRSSLVLDAVEGPSALEANTWTRISTLTHNNVLIRNPASWGPQNIWGRLIITDSDGGPTVVEDDDSVIAIALTETVNTAACAFPSPVGTTCDDFFTFTSVGLADLFFTANDGSQWTASFRFSNLVNAMQVGDTIYTGEARTSSLDVQVLLTQISSVPEPATLGILGLGLLGLGLTKRRKQNA